MGFISSSLLRNLGNYASSRPEAPDNDTACNTIWLSVTWTFHVQGFLSPGTRRLKI